MWITSLKNCLSTFKLFPVSFFSLSFVHFDRKQNQAEENLNHRLNKVEHVFTNIQIAFDFLSVLILKKRTREGDNVEIIDRTAEQIESVTPQVCKESNLWIHPNLRWPRFSLYCRNLK